MFIFKRIIYVKCIKYFPQKTADDFVMNIERIWKWSFEFVILFTSDCFFDFNEITKQNSC